MPGPAARADRGYLGWDVAIYNIDVTLPRQFWSFATTRSRPPAFPTTSRTSRQHPLTRPSPTVRVRCCSTSRTPSAHAARADRHLQLGRLSQPPPGQRRHRRVFLTKKADRNIVSIGQAPRRPPLTGLPTRSTTSSSSHATTTNPRRAAVRAHRHGLRDVPRRRRHRDRDEGRQYFVDTDGNYYELFTYVLYSPHAGVLETSTFPLKVTLGSPANLNATPPSQETPNSVNPQDLVAQINTVSNLIYAAFGPSCPGSRQRTSRSRRSPAPSRLARSPGARIQRLRTQRCRSQHSRS